MLVIQGLGIFVFFWKWDKGVAEVRVLRAEFQRIFLFELPSCTIDYFKPPSYNLQPPILFASRVPKASFFDAELCY